MKITHIIAAGLMIAGIGVSTSASAQSHRDYQSGYDRGHRDNDRRYDRRDDRRWNGHDRGRHYGWRNNHHPHCRTEWRHHHRVRICR